MQQAIKINKFSYFARSRLWLRPQEIWERDQTSCAYKHKALTTFPIIGGRYYSVNLYFEALYKARATLLL